VATCIACGARSRAGDCEGGCTDVPLDLVAAADVDGRAARVAALNARSEALQAVLESATAQAEPDWEALRRAAHDALSLPVPPAPAKAEVVAAWGCPECGRVDAPQPCLDVCIRRPVLMTDVAEYRALEPLAAATEARERHLAAGARLLAHVTPRSDQAASTHDWLRSAVRAALADSEIPVRPRGGAG
jgi:hypothetical protein